MLHALAAEAAQIDHLVVSNIWPITIRPQATADALNNLQHGSHHFGLWLEATFHMGIHLSHAKKVRQAGPHYSCPSNQMSEPTVTLEDNI